MDLLSSLNPKSGPRENFPAPREGAHEREPGKAAEAAAERDVAETPRRNEDGVEKQDTEFSALVAAEGADEPQLEEIVRSKGQADFIVQMKYRSKGGAVSMGGLQQTLSGKFPALSLESDASATTGMPDAGEAGEEGGSLKWQNGKLTKDELADLKAAIQAAKAPVKSAQTPSATTVVQITPGDQGAAAADAIEPLMQAASSSDAVAAAKSNGAQIMTSTASANMAAQASAAMQVAAAIKADRNGNSVDVRLDPPDLGRVRIEFNMDTPDAVKAVLTAERSETLDHLRRNINSLMEELKAAGFASVDLDFSNEGAAAFKEDTPSDFTGKDFAAALPEDKQEIIYLTRDDGSRLNMLA